MEPKYNWYQVRALAGCDSQLSLEESMERWGVTDEDARIIEELVPGLLSVVWEEEEVFRYEGQRGWREWREKNPAKAALLETGGRLFP